ncbi:MAG: hypothetical protein JWR34_3314 [Mycobacterium sp.]|nr:hypothetical protein [Mycobacterium sp.]
MSVALADDSGQASQESSSGSVGSDSGGSSADGAGSHTSPAESPSSSAASDGQASVVSPSSSSSSDEKGSASSSASTGSKSDADDKTAVTAQTNTGSLQSGSTQTDDQTATGLSAKHSGVSESSSSPSSEGPSSESASISTLASSSASSSVADRASSSAAVVSTPAAALMSAPVVAETVAAVADSGPSVAAASNPVIPWALQVVAPNNNFLGDQVTGFFAAFQAFVAQLPLPTPFKDLLNGAAFAVRQTLLNQTPTVAPILLTGLSDTLITGHVDAVDPEGDQIVYRLVQGPASGSVQLNSDGSFVYTPGVGFNGVDTFVVMAQDLGLHVNLLNPFRGAGASAGALVNEGAIKFSFNYTTGSDLWTDDRRAALEQAAAGYNAYLLVTQAVTLTYDVSATNTPGDGILASAGSGLISSAPGFWRTVVQNKLISGIDSNGAAADGAIDWNFGYPWALGDSVGNTEYDLTTVALHELMHSFGFLSLVGSAGSNTGRGWSVFDSFISTINGTRAIRPDYTWNTAFDANLTGGNGGLYFGGVDAVTAYGALVPLYTPSPWEDGSAISHLDDATFTGTDRNIMNAQLATGPGVRIPNAIELGILAGIGYTVITVPVPGGSAVAIVGFIFLRRARRKSPSS